MFRRNDLPNGNVFRELLLESYRDSGHVQHLGYAGIIGVRADYAQDIHAVIVLLLYARANVRNVSA